MEGKPIYTLFPLIPIRPPSLHRPQHRPRHSKDHKRRISLDPLAPHRRASSSAPGHRGLFYKSLPILKPIHSLYNPQPARPGSSRGPSSRQEKRKSLNRQVSSSEDPTSPLYQEIPIENKPASGLEQPEAPSRSSSLKETVLDRHQREQIPLIPHSAHPHPKTMRVSSPSLTLGARVIIPSPSSSSGRIPVQATLPFANPQPCHPTSSSAPHLSTTKPHISTGASVAAATTEKSSAKTNVPPLAYATPTQDLSNGRSKFLQNFFFRQKQEKRKLERRRSRWPGQAKTA